MSLCNVGLRSVTRAIVFSECSIVTLRLGVCTRKYSTEPATTRHSPSSAPPPYVPAQKHPKAATIDASSEKPSGNPASSSKEVSQIKEKSAESNAVAEPTNTVSRWQRMKATVKKEALHYWHGTKLLGKEIRISAGLVKALLRGRKLTRREHRQLKRTSQDLLRLIPFSVFLIVPFMELLLPVALKLFPNMLPSTFADKHKEDEKKRKLLKVRIEMAKFLQDTLRETGVKSPDKIRNSAEFQEFFRKVRATGEKPTTDDIVRVAKLFDDDLTLENLSRPQLVSMCRYMNINAFGTDIFLRHSIRARLTHIERDDKVIEAEGIEALQDAELEKACQSRAIRTHGLSVEKQREQLMQWIDLHLHRGLSGVLLVLSRAFSVGTSIDGQDPSMTSLKDALASLPDTLLNATELEVAADSSDFQKRLEVLQEQEELIEDEREQEEKEINARAAKEAKEQEEREAAEASTKLDEDRVKAESMLDKDQVEASKPADDAETNIRLTPEQLNELGSALEILSARSSVLQERADLKQLAQDNLQTECNCDQDEPQQVALQKKVKTMIAKIDEQLEEYDRDVGAKLNMIELKEGKLGIDDLKKALLEIQHPPPMDKVGTIIDKLDVDHDGFVPMADIKALAEQEGLGILIEEASMAEDILNQSQKLRKDDLFHTPHKHVHDKQQHTA